MKLIVLFMTLVAAIAIYPDALRAGGSPVIDRFEAVPDCILPDPRRHILSYRVSGGIVRASLYAIHRGRRLREFHRQSSRTPIPAMAATGVADPGAASDIESYLLRVIGEGGAEVRRVLFFRYRRAVFDLIPPSFHLRVTTGSGRLAVYQSHATIANIDSLTCSFSFDAPIGGDSGRIGVPAAVITRTDPDSVQCEIRWSSVRKANAGGTIEWTARVTDKCTQGIITRTARVNPIR